MKSSKKDREITLPRAIVYVLAGLLLVPAVVALWFLATRFMEETPAVWSLSAMLLAGLAFLLLMAVITVLWAVRRHAAVSDYEHQLQGMDVLNAMGEAAKIGGWELDVETREGHWTDELHRIFDLPVGQKPTIEDSIEFFHPDDRHIMAEANRNALEKGEPYDLELRFITAGNRHIWVRSICRPQIEEGKVKRLKGVFQDITDRKISEQQRDYLQAQLQQAMKMEAIGRLAGGVAHDFNNLLTGITGYTDLMISSLDPDNPMLNDLNEIQKATQSAIDLSKQLLIFSRKQHIEPKVINLNDLIASMQKMISRLIGEDITLKTILGENLDPVKVDGGQYEQILVNLVINARDAMPDGGMLVIETSNVDLEPGYCQTHPDIQPGPHVMLAVNDTGHGMSEEVKNHLFEPFFTTKPKGRGTGLGLATIYGSVKQSGGGIEVYSEVGTGTAFKIYLPRVEGIPERPEKQKRLVPETIGGHETIMLVEDEKIVRDLAIRILKRLGYKVLQASDGEQALKSAREYKEYIHLLVTDVVMPGINGRQLADRLVKIHPEMQVLFTSGYTDDALAKYGVLGEDINFIGKPYSPTDLAGKIRELLE